MNKIISEIKLIDGVQGVIISSKTGKLIATEGNIDLFNLKDLKELASIVCIHYFPNYVLQFAFKNLYLDIRVIPSGFFILICDPEIDIPLLNLRLNVILKKLKTS